MDLTAWANKHSTWRDGRKCPAVDKAQQPRPDVGRRANRVLSTMNRWPGSVVDELRPQFDASPVKNQTGHLVGEDLVFDVARPKKNAAGGAPSLPLTRPGVHGLGRTSRQDAALDESMEVCSDRRLGERNVAIVAASADGKSHPAPQSDGLLAEPHTRFQCRAHPAVQVAGREACGPKPTHRHQASIRPTIVAGQYEGDGWRMLAYKDGERVRLVSRNGRDQHAPRPRHRGLSKLSARSLVLDGDVAIYDQLLRSRFDGLREPDPDAIASPPLFIAAAEGAVTVLTPRGSGGIA